MGKCGAQPAGCGFPFLLPLLQPGSVSLCFPVLFAVLLLIKTPEMCVCGAWRPHASPACAGALKKQQ